MEVNSGRLDGRANLKPWKPGQSGNPAGKLIGTRQAFSQGFIKDFSTVWQEEGLEAVRKVARARMMSSSRLSNRSLAI